MKLEETKLCIKCGEIFDVPTPGHCPCCNEDSWVWVMAFMSSDVKEELFKTGVLYNISTTANIGKAGD